MHAAVRMPAYSAVNWQYGTVDDDDAGRNRNSQSRKNTISTGNIDCKTFRATRCVKPIVQERSGVKQGLRTSIKERELRFRRNIRLQEKLSFICVDLACGRLDKIDTRSHGKHDVYREHRLEEILSYSMCETDLCFAACSVFFCSTAKLVVQI